MIRINRETDYAIGILTRMARDPQRRYTAPALAEARGLPLPVVGKILKTLVHGGILVSYRGAKGGYGLARAPHSMSVAEIIAVLEGPIALTECVEEGVDACQYGDHCTVSTNWSHINRVVRQALEGISLADMEGTPVAAAPDPQANVHSLKFTGVRYVGDH